MYIYIICDMDINTYNRKEREFDRNKFWMLDINVTYG